jgi:hypothetical protein
VTRRQAFGCRLRRICLIGLVGVPLLMLGPAGLAAALGLMALGLVRVGVGVGVEVDDGGVRPVAGRLPRIGWEEVVDVYAERYGRRTVAALRLESGAAVRLPVPYDGCLLGHDPGFEGKLFMLRQLWETHRRW